MEESINIKSRTESSSSDEHIDESEILLLLFTAYIHVQCVCVNVENGTSRAALEIDD